MDQLGEQIAEAIGAMPSEILYLWGPQKATTGPSKAWRMRIKKRKEKYHHDKLSIMVCIAWRPARHWKEGLRELPIWMETNMAS